MKEVTLTVKITFSEDAHVTSEHVANQVDIALHRYADTASLTMDDVGYTNDIVVTYKE